jgi:hypothetical protein
LLIFHCRSVHKLVVFDVEHGRIVGDVPAEDSDLFAAGATKLFVIHPDKLLVQRYRLDTLRLELTRMLPFGGVVSVAAMGSASEGPLMMIAGGANNNELMFMDVASMERLPLKVEYQRPEDMFLFDQNLEIRASADGSVFTGWRRHSSPTGLYVFTIAGKEVHCRYDHKSGTFVLPDEHGDRIFTDDMILPQENLDLREMRLRPAKSYLIPATTGPLFLRIPLPNLSSGQKVSSDPVTVHLGSEAEPLLSLSGVAANLTITQHTYNVQEQIADSRHLPHPEWIRMDQRVYLVPEAKVLAMLPEEQNCVVLRRFDLKEELARADKDTITFVSQPPRSAAPSETLEYQIKAFAHGGKVRFKLESGPVGMTVTQDGLLRWLVNERPEAADVRVIVSASDDAGHTALHSFAVKIVNSGRPTAATPRGQNPRIAARPQDASPSPPPTIVMIEKSKAPSSIRSSDGDLAISPAKWETAEVTCPLGGVCDEVCAGAGGRFLIFRIKSQHKLAVVDVCSGKVAGQLKLGEDDALFAASGAKLIVIQPKKMTVQRYSLDTLKLETTSQLSIKQPVTAAAMGSASAGPLLLFAGNDVDARPYFLDLVTLKPLPIKIDNLTPTRDSRPVMRASADGHVFVWGTAFGFHVVRMSGGKLIDSNENDEFREGCPRLDETGDRLYAGTHIHSSRGKVLGSAEQFYLSSQLVPALQGPMYLSVPGANTPNHEFGGPVTIHLDGQPGPLLALPELTKALTIADRRSSEFIVADQRVFLIPAADVLAYVPDARNSVVLRHFNVKDEMKAAGIDGPVVVSRPPRALRLGEKLEYQIDTWSKAGGIACSLEAGPSDMTVTGEGLLSWTASKRIGGAEHIVVAVKDAAGRIVRHAFELQLEDGKPERAAVAAAPAVYRTFSDATGRFKIEAIFVGVQDGKVRLLKRDGNTILVPLEKLAPADQQWIKQH